MELDRDPHVAGRTLFEIVEQYSAFGNHWTGTQVDFATADWLTALLDEMGANPHPEPWQFDRFASSVSLSCDGVEIPALPVWYSAIGEFETDELALVHAESARVGNARGLDDALAEGQAAVGSTGGIVIAIDGPADLAVQCNRVPQEPDGLPAVIIPSNWAFHVRQGTVLRFTGALSAGKSANILATFGPAEAPVVRLTTPLTGWTPAAGERATGLAVALAMAQDLADEYRVEFSACAGHELDHLGLRHHLAQRNLEGEVAIHLGASVAACEPGPDGSLELCTTRMTLTSTAGPARERIRDLAQTANFSLLDMEPPWPGEGGTWLDAGASVLSFLGSSPLFHVVDDVPAKATTPAALATAAATTIAAARTYLEDCLP